MRIHFRARSRRTRLVAALLLAAVGLVLVGGSAQASIISLPGSNFEIDSDANLTVEGSAPSVDWGSVTEVRKPDSPSGAADESFGQGTKEDTADPKIVNGGIPPNKSDLKFFGVYQEGAAPTAS